MAKGEGQGNEEGRNLASSVALQDELDNVQKKVERFHKRRELEDYPEVKDARQAVLSCYQLSFLSSSCPLAFSTFPYKQQGFSLA